MILYFLTLYVSCLIYDGSNEENSFSFINHKNKEVNLKKKTKYFSNKNMRKNLQLKSQTADEGQWYYVHFLTHDLTEMQKYIKIQSKDELIKNTFVLFLTSDQLEKISNISLYKNIDPSEKYVEDGGKLESTDLFIVYTSDNYKLPLLNNDYVIENMQENNIYILKFLQNKLNEKEFNKKKKKIIQLLSKIPEIKSISTYQNPKLNNAIVSGFTQKNSFDFQYNNKSDFFFLDRYLNKNGITGKNQTITILDTPIDFYHSMFYDSTVQIKLNTYMPNHRKIVYYNFQGNLNDLMNSINESEHGTHVAGTAAGKSICSNDDKDTSYFNGNAPDAKILFAGYFNNVTTDELQQLMNNYNSKISSNSWSTIMPYNLRNYQYGHLAELNPNLTFIFAAGNEYLTDGNFSVYDPSSSKNILTVGSLDNFYIKDKIFNISSKSNPNLWILAIGPYFDDPWFSGTIGTEPGKSDILAIDLDKGNQCKLLNQNKFILLYGKDLNWIDTCDLKGLNILIAMDSMPILKEILESKADVYISQIFVIDKEKGIEKASYSSTGPGNKGILKPDVMAPGTRVISSKSRARSNLPHGCRDDNENDFTTKDGTSMATPNVAGAAALVHDYFLSGKWIDKVSLDGPTTRALLINSCKHPLNTKTPDNFYGHGAVDLSSILPIENNFGVRITHQGDKDTNKKPFVNENGHKLAKISVDNITNKDLQITLSYLDPMLNMDSPIPLTHDLDLVVVSPSKKVFLGDHLPNGDSQHASANEKVIIRDFELEEGEYLIHVYGSKFIDSNIVDSSKEQEFAVVASGPIENGYIEFVESSECPCEKCDPNHNGYCLCDENTAIGPICQSKIETFYGTQSAFYVQSLAIRRIKIISPKKIKYLFSKSRNPGKDSTIWVSKTCHYTLGEYEINGYTTNESTSFGAKTKINFNTKEICVAIFNNNDRDANYIIEVTNIPKYDLFMILIGILVLVILVMFILLCYFCCCRHKKCCRCCKCCNKDDFDSGSMSQFSINDRLIN